MNDTNFEKCPIPHAVEVTIDQALDFYTEGFEVRCFVTTTRLQPEPEVPEGKAPVALLNAPPKKVYAPQNAILYVGNYEPKSVDSILKRAKGDAARILAPFVIDCIRKYGRETELGDKVKVMAMRRKAITQRVMKMLKANNIKYSENTIRSAISTMINLNIIHYIKRK